MSNVVISCLNLISNSRKEITFRKGLEMFRFPAVKSSFRFTNTVKVTAQLTTEVYRKLTDKGLLLHFQSHVDSRYKKGLLNTMVNRAYRLSSTNEGFAKQCKKLRTIFSKLRYPKTLVDFTSQEPGKEIHTVPSADPSVYMVLPFQGQRSHRSST